MARRTAEDEASRRRVAGGAPVKRGDRQATKFGFRAEARLADRLGAKSTVGSGNKSDKGDMTVDQFRIEAKATTARSIRVELAWLQKIGEQATRTGYTPALAIQFTDRSGRAETDGSWVAIPEHVFARLTRLLADAQEDPE